MRKQLFAFGIAMTLLLSGCEDRDNHVNDGESGKHITLNRYSYKITAARDDSIFSEDTIIRGWYGINRASAGTFETEKPFSKILYFSEPTNVNVEVHGNGLVRCAIVVEDTKENTRKSTHDSHITKTKCAIK